MQQDRVHFMDEVRGFAVFCMVFYHAFFFLGEIAGIRFFRQAFDFFTPLEPMFAGAFIFISGISSRLSKSNLKRGLRLAAIAAGLTLVTAFLLPALGFSDCEIWFGILHFLACAILLFALLQPALDRVPPFAGILGCAVLYPFFAGIPEGVLRYGELVVLRLPDALYRTNWLVPLGFYNSTFASADYFPLLPDSFIFLAGAFCGAICLQRGFPAWSYPQRVRFFGFLGRHALPIYLIHLPAVAGISAAVQAIMNMK
ncbi:MAG: DUF1624 domain-containing protein [Clostridia bacterium]|nr:DUF1624 domain-containing protein [Clostridia bacterium]